MEKTNNILLFWIFTGLITMRNHGGFQTLYKGDFQLKPTLILPVDFYPFKGQFSTSIQPLKGPIFARIKRGKNPTESAVILT